MSPGVSNKEGFDQIENTRLGESEFVGIPKFKINLTDALGKESLAKEEIFCYLPRF